MRKFRFGNVLTNAFAIFSVLLFSFVLFVNISGAKAYAVLSDSMVPVFSKGSVVFVKQVSFSELAQGDIVSVKFKDKSGVFTHRITDIDDAKKLITTKGDSSISEDPEQSAAEQIIGRYWFSVPYAGYLALNVKNYAVIYFLIALASLLLVSRVIVQIKKKANS